MSKLIPPAKLEDLLMVNHVKRDRPHLDIRQAVRAALGATATREEMVTVASRLVALTNALMNPELKPWISEVGKERATAHIAVWKAAARAPLVQPEYANDLAFDLEAFKSILREEGGA